MASSLIVHNLSSLQSLQYPQRYRTHTLSLTNSHFLSSNSVLNLKKQFLLPNLKLKVPTAQKHRFTPLVFAARSNFLKVIQTVWKIGKDGVDAGTTFVPESVPRPIARISVTAAVLIVALFVLKSFLSTAFFALATMGLVYFVYISLNNDQGPRGGGGGGAKSAEDSLAEARRIMEKYK